MTFKMLIEIVFSSLLVLNAGLLFPILSPFLAASGTALLLFRLKNTSFNLWLLPPTAVSFSVFNEWSTFSLSWCKFFAISAIVNHVANSSELLQSLWPLIDEFVLPFIPQNLVSMISKILPGFTAMYPTVPVDKTWVISMFIFFILPQNGKVLSYLILLPLFPIYVLHSLIASLPKMLISFLPLIHNNSIFISALNYFDANMVNNEYKLINSTHSILSAVSSTACSIYSDNLQVPLNITYCSSTPELKDEFKATWPITTKAICASATGNILQVAESFKSVINEISSLGISPFVRIGSADDLEITDAFFTPVNHTVEETQSISITWLSINDFIFNSVVFVGTLSHFIAVDLNSFIVDLTSVELAFAVVEPFIQSYAALVNVALFRIILVYICSFISPNIAVFSSVLILKNLFASFVPIVPTFALVALEASVYACFSYVVAAFYLVMSIYGPIEDFGSGGVPILEGFSAWMGYNLMGVTGVIVGPWSFIAVKNVCRLWLAKKKLTSFQ